MSTLGKVSLTGAATTLTCLAVAGSASASTSCDLVASPDGSDAAPGTVEAPLLHVQYLVDSLEPGQTGCLRTGEYRDTSDDEIKIGVADVTLTSYPEERATVIGRIYVPTEADGVTISELDLDGRNPTSVPSPTINSDDVVVRGNDITNHHTGICMSLGNPARSRARRTLVVDNAIHDCGRLPATNQDHGIYVNSTNDVVIKNNWIYDNADRGIQLYSDAQDTKITGNVIDGNGEGVIFGGDSDSTSSGNVVQGNVITNSKIRDNLDSSWGGDVGRNNVARDNCVGGGAYDDGDGGIKDDPDGFKSVDNVVKIPDFANAKRGDFTVASSTICGRLVAGLDPGPSGSEDGDGSVPVIPPVVTIDPAKTEVAALKPIRVSGSAPGASRVKILVRHGRRWHRVGSDQTNGDDAYRLKIRLADPGRETVKAVAGGLRDSKQVKLRVKKSHH
jgi:parallel beta-helix repeat protein